MLGPTESQQKWWIGGPSLGPSTTRNTRDITTTRYSKTRERQTIVSIQ